jgi:predicted RecB family nuclease
MQRLPDGSLRFSPSDLIQFLEGDFAAWCERFKADSSGKGQRIATEPALFQQDGDDEERALAARRGIAHEVAYLELLRAREPGLVSIPNNAHAADATSAAMQAGAPIVYQGTLNAGDWTGIADFLHRVDHGSKPNEHLYEPWDTKLARSVKPYFIIQLCAYADMLESIQGWRPERLGFILGDGSESSLRTEDFWHYYRRLKQTFERFQREWKPALHPDPAIDRNHGRWSDAAKQHLERMDDLSLVAGITHSQRVRLRDAGIHTVAALASCTDCTVPHLSGDRLQSLQEQAAMQVATRTSDTIRWSLRATDENKPRRGLALLPPPSNDDVFFDIEGFPYAPGGLEYLLGVVTVDTGAPVFRDWWAHDEAQEKVAFEAFVDWVFARWQKTPAMHIYHYAAYERTALSRLMGKYATREYEIDELLRNHVLVDLYPVVLQGMVIGTPSYSLKDVEHLYMPPRDGEVTSAGGSVVEYQRWIDKNESQDPAQSPVLNRIREYNKVDCESTVGLRDWLVAQQAEAGIDWRDPKALAAQAPASPYERTPAEELASTLLARADSQPDGSEDQRVTRLLAWLLEFHRREAA